MNSFIVGVDISTTSTKVIIFDNYGKEISSGITKYDVIKLKQGFFEQKAECPHSIPRLLSCHKLAKPDH